MEKTILTTYQKKLLGALSKDKFITGSFFLTGGTALSEFYFKHRYSEDFDFFSEREFDSRKLLASISQISKILKADRIEQQSLNSQETFFLSFKKDTVKLDFAYFPFLHLGKFKKIGKLNLSSVEDICTNKVHAITTRSRARDYLDLYLCMRYLKWTSKDLIKNYRLKFDVNLAPEQLATSFTNVQDAQDLPIFLGKIPKDEFKEYFLKQATMLKTDIIS